MNCQKVLFMGFLFAAIWGLTGCGPKPSQEDVTAGVNKALSKVITVQDYGLNLFEGYSINNRYTETKDGEQHFVYDFAAQCKVCKIQTLRLGDSSFRSAWGQYVPGAPGSGSFETKTISGSFYLVRKGQKWYVGEVDR